MNVVAACSVRCGQEVHRVGVTARGQAVMLDHDREAERLAVALEREAETECARVYQTLVRDLASRKQHADGRPWSGPLSSPAYVQPGETYGDLDAYVEDARAIDRRRTEREVHHKRLDEISVLGSGPALLAPDIGDYTQTADAIVRQYLLRAREGQLERLIPALFLRACRYPIVGRHPPSGPGVKRGACWHVTVGDLGPDDEYPVATRPHPSVRGRVCVSVTVPLAPNWYRDVYKPGLALLDGALVVANFEHAEAHDPALVTVLRQHGARFRLERATADPDPGAPGGWRLRRLALPLEGTGARPSPWD